ncbi:MAG: hypothetical protein JKY49_01710 [Cohaesibacteraceae bacterium]|nr:hypothetical protein [Cohaesibacteraceae bacterium]
MARPTTVILLMHQIEGAFFRDEVRRRVPDIACILVDNEQDLISAALGAEKPLMVLSFHNPIIVPPLVLEEIDAGAFNVHPGPPSRPGYRPMEFAWFDEDRNLGATLHHMNEKVDEGQIIDVSHFVLKPNAEASIEFYEGEAYKVAVVLTLKHLSAMLGKGKLPKSRETWSGQKTTKRQLALRYEKDGGAVAERCFLVP